MARKYFGTDGIRGEVGKSPITPDFIMRLGYATGIVLQSRRSLGQRPSVLIGKDTRISGYLLEAALEAGLTSAGVDVVKTGPIPTPAVAYLTRALRLSAGIVISASHNPYYDNGIKFFSGDGNKFPDQTELEIEKTLDSPLGCTTSDKLGRVRRMEDASGRYVEFCKSTFPADLDLRGMKIVLDCANGAAYETAPNVFHELGAEVIVIGNKPDGLNINLEVGATHPETLRKAVLENHAHLGIALDGDADRLIMVDATGRIYNGDELLYVLVKDRHAQGHVGGAVGTLMSNLALEQAFKRLGVGFARAKVGDRYVLEQLQERGWLYGGESSGHILALDCHTTGDATISALQILAAIKRSGLQLADLLRELQLFPQRLINVTVAKDFDWKTHAGLQQTQLDVESELGDDGRILIRASGTEPLLRFMVEAKTQTQADVMAKRLADAIA
jgi:phosphoglucosamine mutase